MSLASRLCCLHALHYAVVIIWLMRLTALWTTHNRSYLIYSIEQIFLPSSDYLAYTETLQCSYGCYVTLT